MRAWKSLLAAFLCTGLTPEGRADEGPRGGPAAFAELGLGMRQVGGTMSYAFDTPATNKLTFPVGVYAAEAIASAGIRWPSGAALAASITGRRSLSSRSGDARIETIAPLSSTISDSRSQVIFQEAEFRLGAAVPFGSFVELAPFASVAEAPVSSSCCPRPAPREPPPPGGGPPPWPPGGPRR